MGGSMNVLTKCYTRDSELVTLNVAGETIIVPIKSNAGDLNSIFTLNEVGTLIWELMDGENSISRIVEVISNTYEVKPEEAEKDTLQFINSLEQAGMIRTIENKKE
jgi:hypothetical protein